MKKFKILVINPGSTSTKVAVFANDKELTSVTLRHTGEEISQFRTIPDQLDFRKHIILDALKEAKIELGDIDAVIGRGGLVKHIPSGVYGVNDKMIYDILNRPLGHHASNLGALLANDIALMAGAKAYIADPVTVDELQRVARVTGLPEIEHISIFHALNQKAVARLYADSIGAVYEDLNLIVAHMGGGISVGAHEKGKVIDVNNALNGEGPFSPERSGALPALALAEMCFSGKFDFEQIAAKINGQGGLFAHLGTTNVGEVVERVKRNDRQAKTVLDALCYNIAKSIGSMATVLKGQVDAIILTGGIAYNGYVCDYIKDMTAYIAPTVVSPGENEMEALAMNALKVLEGKLVPSIYK